MGQAVRNDLQIIHPLGGAFAITPSDVNNLPKKTRAVYVGESGDLSVVMADGTEITYVGLAAGIFHPLQVIKVNSSGTTATEIIGGV